jgi:hypothetical protein
MRLAVSEPAIHLLNTLSTYDETYIAVVLCTAESPRPKRNNNEISHAIE